MSPAARDHRPGDDGDVRHRRAATATRWPPRRSPPRWRTRALTAATWTACSSARARASARTGWASRWPAGPASATCACSSTWRSRARPRSRWSPAPCSPSGPAWRGPSCACSPTRRSDRARRPGSTYAHSGGNAGVRGLERASGVLGSVPTFALLASRYLHVSGGTEADLCAVAVSARAWASGSEQAVNRTPLDDEGYYASRMISAPLRVLDCARPVNGAVAVIVSSERPAGRAAPAIEIRGMGAVAPDAPPARGRRVLVRRRRPGGRRRAGHGGHQPRRPGRGRALRPVLDRDALPARGVRLLRRRPGGQVRPRRRHRARRRAAGQHRRRPAVRLLPAGHDPAGRGAHPAARRPAATARCPARRRRSSPGSAAASTTTRPSSWPGRRHDSTARQPRGRQPDRGPGSAAGTPYGAADWLVAPELAPDAGDPDWPRCTRRPPGARSPCRSAPRARTPLELEQYVCDACGASAEVGTAGREWRDVPLAGTVHTATLVHRREPGLIVAAGALPGHRCRAGERTPPRPHHRRAVRAGPGHRRPRRDRLPHGRRRHPAGGPVPPVRIAGCRKSLTGDQRHDGHRPGSRRPRPPPGCAPATSARSSSRTASAASCTPIPQVYDLEMRRIFREGWVFVAHESEVPEPGDYVTKRIAGEPVHRRARQGRRGPGDGQPVHAPRQPAVQRGQGQQQLLPLPVPRMDVQQRRQPVRRADAGRVRRALRRDPRQPRAGAGAAAGELRRLRLRLARSPRASPWRSTSATPGTRSTGWWRCRPPGASSCRRAG